MHSTKKKLFQNSTVQTTHPNGNPSLFQKEQFLFANKEELTQRQATRFRPNRLSTWIDRINGGCILSRKKHAPNTAFSKRGFFELIQLDISLTKNK